MERVFNPQRYSKLYTSINLDNARYEEHVNKLKSNLSESYSKLEKAHKEQAQNLQAYSEDFKSAVKKIKAFGSKIWAFIVKMVKKIILLIEEKIIWIRNNGVTREKLLNRLKNQIVTLYKYTKEIEEITPEGTFFNNPIKSTVRRGRVQKAPKIYEGDKVEYKREFNRDSDDDASQSIGSKKLNFTIDWFSDKGKVSPILLLFPDIPVKEARHLAERGIEMPFIASKSNLDDFDDIYDAITGVDLNKVLTKGKSKLDEIIFHDSYIINLYSMSKFFNMMTGPNGSDSRAFLNSDITKTKDEMVIKLLGYFGKGRDMDGTNTAKILKTFIENQLMAESMERLLKELESSYDNLDNNVDFVKININDSNYNEELFRILNDSKILLFALYAVHLSMQNFINIYVGSRRIGIELTHLTESDIYRVLVKGSTISDDEMNSMLQSIRQLVADNNKVNNTIMSIIDEMSAQTISICSAASRKLDEVIDNITL